jgi:3-hydroxyacyl-[acyl-carrier-protein] dehydratase
MRFFLIDRIIELEENQRIEGLKCWTLSDEIFQDHFPGYPVVPGVLLIESMAQLLGILVSRSYRINFPDKDEDVFALLSVVHRAVFNKFVVPGDQTHLVATLGTMDTLRASGKIVIDVDGEVRAKSELSFFLVPESQLIDDAVIEEQNKYFKILTHGMAAGTDTDK